MASMVVTSLPSNITSLSDKQLFDNLRKYNINVGPVLPSTRSVYQRKLYALTTNQAIQVCSMYPPADDDDIEDDEQRVYREPPAPQPRPRTPERAEFRGERKTDFVSSLTRRPLHAGIGDYLESRTHSTRKKVAVAAKTERGQPTSWGRWRGLAVLLVIAIVAVCYFVYRNMESEPVSNIPDEIDMEV